MSSIDDTIKELKRIQKNLKKVDGTHTYTFKELFNDEFMQEHSKFSTISDFFEASGLDFSSQEAFRNIDVEKLDKYISENSDFSSWEEMKATAGNAILDKQIFS